MNKPAICVITVLLVLLFGLQVCGFTIANPIPWPDTPNLQETPTLIIKTPQNYTTYGVGNVVLDFSVVQPDAWIPTYSFFYHLGKIARIEVSLDGGPSNSADSSQMLTNLTLGTHELNVTVLSYAYYRTPLSGFQNVPSGIVSTTYYDGLTTTEKVYQYPIVISDIVYFIIEPPKILIYSPQTTTYDKSSVSLIYSINQSTPQICYSIDGQKNKTETRTATFNYLAHDELNATLYTTLLTDLSNGKHKVTVYATDEVGNLGSQTVEFTVENSPATDSNILLYGFVFAIIPVAAVCLIVGLRSYRRKKSS